MRTETLRSFRARIAPLVLLIQTAVIFGCSPEIRDYDGQGGAGTSSSSSGGTQCTTDAECGAGDECQSFGCMNGYCQVMFAAMGTAIAVQATGDCQSSVCDGQGVVINVEALSDPADDGNPCTLDACAGTQTQHGYFPAETPCEGGRFCDGVGACVECLNNSHCGSGVCAASHDCASAMCTDLVKNGLESDVDCGGSDCPACPAGFACNGFKDCKSIVCQNGTCAEPACNDGVRNGSESDVDCGGPVCGACATGQSCNAGLDCKSGVCVGNACQEPACNDTIKNGDESDTDCGGSCLRCPNGKGCVDGGDCISFNCCIDNAPMPGYCIPTGALCALLQRSEITQ